MEIQEVTNRLNRIYTLYAHAIGTAKPYRIHKIRKIYVALYEQACTEYKVIPLESASDFEQLLGHGPIKSEFTERKVAAVRNGEYETAASLRDQEKAYFRLKIQQARMNPDDYFFVSKDNTIFFKKW